MIHGIFVLICKLKKGSPQHKDIILHNLQFFVTVLICISSFAYGDLGKLGLLQLPPTITLGNVWVGMRMVHI